MKINDNYTEFIYEAAYLAKMTDFFETQTANTNAYTAAKRILNSFEIDSSEKVMDFLDQFQSYHFQKNAEALYETFLKENKNSFFDQLNQSEMDVYNYLNCDISYDYGCKLCEHIDFSGKSIMDIGGNSGGLLKGIQDKAKNTTLTVFDRKEATEVGKQLNHGINFISGDFFTHKIMGNYDYIILSNIIHDWSDYNNSIILHNLKSVLINDTKLIIHEDILCDDSYSFLFGLRLSINFFDAKQRTVDEITNIVKTAWHDAKLERFINYNILSACVYGF